MYVCMSHLYKDLVVVIVLYAHSFKLYKICDL